MTTFGVFIHVVLETSFHPLVDRVSDEDQGCGMEPKAGKNPQCHSMVHNHPRI